MRESVIVSAVRTPTGKFLGALKSFTATQLGALVVAEAVRRAGIDPQIVDECIMGNVVSAGLGQSPARQAALHGGLPDHVAALTINKVCGSGLKAVMIADQAIRAGDIDVAVAGGMESMSNCPYLLPITTRSAVQLRTSTPREAIRRRPVPPMKARSRTKSSRSRFRRRKAPPSSSSATKRSAPIRPSTRSPRSSPRSSEMAR